MSKLPSEELPGAQLYLKVGLLCHSVRESVQQRKLWGTRAAFLRNVYIGLVHKSGEGSETSGKQSTSVVSLLSGRINGISFGNFGEPYLRRRKK